MPIITQTLSEQEEEVILAAINFVQQKRNGLYRDMEKSQEVLNESVDKLLMENDGRWSRES